MKRRLDLAASMVGRTSILFLDEPTTGIDPRSRVDLWELIDELKDQMGGDGAGSSTQVGYINFLLPGLLAQTALFGATQTSVGLTEDLAAGFIDRYRRATE